MQTQALGWEGRQRKAWKSDEGSSGGGWKEAALTGAQVMFEPEEKGDSGGLMGWLGLGELVKVSGGK